GDDGGRARAHGADRARGAHRAGGRRRLHAGGGGHHGGGARAAPEAGEWGSGKEGGGLMARRALSRGAVLLAAGGVAALAAWLGEGRTRPFEPTRAALDLPIAASGDAGVAALLALIQSVDPALFQTITAARVVARGDVLLESGARRVLVRRDAGLEVIRAVVTVAQDLAAKGRPYAELDARFAGQVIVRRKGGAGGAKAG